MLLDGGVLDGVRILGRKTVATMTSNQNARLPKGRRRTRASASACPWRSRCKVASRRRPAFDHGEFAGAAATTAALGNIDPQERVDPPDPAMPFDQPQAFAVYSTMVNAAID